MQTGGLLVIEGGSLSNGSATGGTGGGNGATDGQGFGAGIFIQGGNSTITLAPAAGQTLDIRDGIADQTGSDAGNVYNQPGTASLVLPGAGTVRLGVADNFAGGIHLENGTLELDALNAAGSGAIGIEDPSMLRIGASLDIANTVDGFGVVPASWLDFPGIAPGAGTTAILGPGNVLTVSDLVHTQTLTLDPTHTFPHNTFPTVSDGAGGVVVACYVAGTRIATPVGDAAVEDLRIGDAVLTAAGAARAVKWIGRRSYAAPMVRANPQLRPVRIGAGALGGELPARDLLVSPLHGVMVDGLLLAAGALVNGGGIRREPPAEVRYLHLELDRHELLLAEGFPAESFCDQDSRGMFQNSAEFTALYPDAPRQAPRGMRTEHGAAFERVLERLAPPRGSYGPLLGHVERMRGGVLEGWAMDAADPLARVVLEVTGEGIAPLLVVAGQYRIDLDRAGLADGCCGFRALLPAGVRSVRVCRAHDGAALPMRVVRAA